MDRLPILRRFGFPDTGSTEGESGFGFQAIGKDDRGQGRYGFPDIGNVEAMAGFGRMDTGSIGEGAETQRLERGRRA